jgi:hypothetical protein
VRVEHCNGNLVCPTNQMTRNGGQIKAVVHFQISPSKAGLSPVAAWSQPSILIAHSPLTVSFDNERSVNPVFLESCGRRFFTFERDS